MWEGGGIRFLQDAVRKPREKLKRGTFLIFSLRTFKSSCSHRSSTGLRSGDCFVNGRMQAVCFFSHSSFSLERWVKKNVSSQAASVEYDKVQKNGATFQDIFYPVQISCVTNTKVFPNHYISSTCLTDAVHVSKTCYLL